MNKDIQLFHLSMILLIYGIVFLLVAFHNIDLYQNMLRMSIYEQFNLNDYVENNLFGIDSSWTETYISGLWAGIIGIFMVSIGSFFLGRTLERLIYKPKTIIK